MIKKIVVRKKEQRKIQYNYSYQAALAASKRIGWKVDDIIGGEKKLDFTKPFMHGVTYQNDRDTEDRKHRKGIAVEALYYLRSVAVYSSFLTSSRDEQAGNCNHQIGLFSIVENRRFTVGIVGVYLFSVGLLSGMLFDRIRFDASRTVLIKELDDHKQRLNQRLMAVEREGFVER